MNIGRGITVAGRFGRAAVAAVVLLVGLDGVWLGLNYLNQTTTGVIVAVVLATLLGAVVAAWQPGPWGWFGLIVGGGAGAIGISLVGLPFVLNNAWGILGLFGLAVWNVLLIGIFGSLGFGYWVGSGWILQRGVHPSLSAALRATLVVILAAGVILGGRIAIPEQPEPIYVRNDTAVSVQFFKYVRGSWRGVWGDRAVWYLPGNQSRLIDPTNPSNTGPGEVLGSDGCTTVDILARDPAGAEVARHAPGLCEGDLWVIGSPVPTR